ncbi:MAG: galactose mutarotase [Pseudomonadota bacterium]
MIDIFGVLDDGTQVDVITLGSAELGVKILTLGAIIHDVRLTGVDWPLTLGTTDVAGYRGPLKSFGSFMGPVVNRIKGAKATIDGETFEFETHRSGNLTQHSGSTGLQNLVWAVVDQGDSFVVLSIDLPDGLGGFPGNRTVTVRYDVHGAALRMTATATTDAPTLMNPANHSYWVMDPGLGYAGHTLTIDADRYTITGTDLMPTGDLPLVAGTGYDFRKGLTLAGDDSQFFDLNLCMADGQTALRPIATLRGTSGVQMEMSTTECGLQVYDCGTISAPGFATHHGADIGPYSGVALEAQSWPGALEHDHFPPIVLRPGETYAQTTQWAFSKDT